MSDVYVKFESRLPAIVAIGVHLSNESVEHASEKIVQGCQARSRVESGTMRDGWTMEQVESETWRVYNPVSWTIFNELGTMYMSPQPMLIPTLEEVMPEFEAEVASSWFRAGTFTRMTPGGRI